MLKHFALQLNMDPAKGFMLTASLLRNSTACYCWPTFIGNKTIGGVP